MKNMKLTSPAFFHGEIIPDRFGRDFENINPSLIIASVPSDAVSLIVIMEDPDVPEAAGVPVWDHWIVFNIPPEMTQIPEAWKPVGVRGKGTRGELEYGGPRPPDREHRYYFRVYALDCMLDLSEGSLKCDLLNIAEKHILASAELMGRFSPKKIV
jgi:Raf kinase inhibitor-like YbhB/YbcL family protein